MDVIGLVYDKMLGLFGHCTGCPVIILSIIRSVRGPGIADRIIAVNMIGTMITAIIAILSVKWMRIHLGDALIYATC